jgi:hypothetical protein
MKNENLIAEIRESSENILESLQNRQIQEFQIKDLDIESGVYLKDMPLRGKALRGVLSTLRVKGNFTDASRKLSPQDWTTISQKLKQTEAETKMYARVTKNDNGDQEITEVFQHNHNKKGTDDASYRQYLEWISNSLAESKSEFSMKKFHYDPRTETMDLVLLNNDKTVDAFGTGLDLWKMGDRFSFNGLQFNYAPFFERLICSNGNIATEYGFGANIAQAKFNNQRVKGTIEKALLHESDKISNVLQDSVAHLKNNNISLSEFYAFQRFFEIRNENGRYDGLIARFFNDQPFYRAYGMDIKGKSRKWLSTANSGINSYDFFNMITWIASHPGEVRVDSQDRTNLQIAASSHLLFKKELDLEDIATSIKVDYPRIAAMN